MSAESIILGARDGAAASPVDDLVKETTTEAFRADVIDASHALPVLVDFWAPWCGPCRQLTPILEKVVRAAKGKVRLVKMNIDEHPAIAGQLGIQSIPAVVAFRNGQPLDGFMGALPESQVTAFLERIAGPVGPSDAERAVAAADAALAAGDAAGAADLYARALQQDPARLDALAGLVRCEAALGNLEQARALVSALEDTQRRDAAIAGALAALELAEQAALLGNPADFRKKLEADPDDHQARFDLALALNAAGDRSGAVEALMEIVRRDREWNDAAARRQLLQFFEAWGIKDPAAVKGRQRLSSLLFS